MTELKFHVTIQFARDINKHNGLKVLSVGSMKTNSNDNYHGPVYATYDAIQYLRQTDCVDHLTCCVYSDITPLNSTNNNHYKERIDLTEAERRKLSLPLQTVRNVLLQSYERNGQYDIIDVTALDKASVLSTYFESIVLALADGGIVNIGCSDIQALCNNNPEQCFRYFGVMPIKHSMFSKESSIRILLTSLDNIAKKHDRQIIPLLSIAENDNTILFVQIKHVTNNYETSKRILLCQSLQCPYYITQETVALVSSDHISKGVLISSTPLREVKQNKNRPYSADCYSANKLILHTKCPETGSEMILFGPLWGGPIHNQSFVDTLLSHLQFENNKSENYLRIISSIQEELKDCPFYYSINKINALLGGFDDVNNTQHSIRNALVNSGYQYSQSHCNMPDTIKTNAPPQVIWDIFRTLSQMNSYDNQSVQSNNDRLSNAEYIQKLIRDRILSNPNTIHPNFNNTEEKLSSKRLLASANKLLSASSSSSINSYKNDAPSYNSNNHLYTSEYDSSDSDYIKVMDLPDSLSFKNKNNAKNDTNNVRKTVPFIQTNDNDLQSHDNWSSATAIDYNDSIYDNSPLNFSRDYNEDKNKSKNEKSNNNDNQRFRSLSVQTLSNDNWSVMPTVDFNESEKNIVHQMMMQSPSSGRLLSFGGYSFDSAESINSPRVLSNLNKNMNEALGEQEIINNNNDNSNEISSKNKPIASGSDDDPLDLNDPFNTIDSVDPEDVNPINHNSYGLKFHPDGTLKLTNNSSLNNLLRLSFSNFVRQYAHGNELTTVLGALNNPNNKMSIDTITPSSSNTSLDNFEERVSPLPVVQLQKQSQPSNTRTVEDITSQLQAIQKRNQEAVLLSKYGLDNNHTSPYNNNYDKNKKDIIKAKEKEMINSDSDSDSSSSSSSNNDNYNDNFDENKVFIGDFDVAESLEEDDDDDLDTIQYTKNSNYHVINTASSANDEMDSLHNFAPTLGSASIATLSTTTFDRNDFDDYDNVHYNNKFYHSIKAKNQKAALKDYSLSQAQRQAQGQMISRRKGGVLAKPSIDDIQENDESSDDYEDKNEDENDKALEYRIEQIDELIRKNIEKIKSFENQSYFKESKSDKSTSSVSPTASKHNNSNNNNEILHNYDKSSLKKSSNGTAATNGTKKKSIKKNKKNSLQSSNNNNNNYTSYSDELMNLSLEDEDYDYTKSRSNKTQSNNRNNNNNNPLSSSSSSLRNSIGVGSSLDGLRKGFTISASVISPRLTSSISSNNNNRLTSVLSNTSSFSSLANPTNNKTLTSSLLLNKKHRRQNSGGSGGSNGNDNINRKQTSSRIILKK
eukprot:gene5270-7322_t